jgi:predicted nucleotidyltransferase
MVEVVIPVGLPGIMNVLADWADPLPLARVCVFGSRVRGDHRDDSDLDLALELDSHPSSEQVSRWTAENATDFSALKAALGVPLSIHIEQWDCAWPAIRRAAKQPVLRDRKILAIITPPKGDDGRR